MNPAEAIAQIDAIRLAVMLAAGGHAAAIQWDRVLLDLAAVRDFFLFGERTPKPNRPLSGPELEAEAVELERHYEQRRETD